MAGELAPKSQMWPMLDRPRYMLGSAACRGMLYIGIVAACLLNAPGNAAARTTLTDDQVRQAMIEESIRSYSGSCPCPYSSARNGSRCGGRSAYSRPSGASPLCYPGDITDEMVRSWRKRRGM